MSLFERIKQVYQRLTVDGSTEKQAVQSGIWAAGINIGDRLLQLTKVIILARLLPPAAFGLLGIALLVVSALRRFSNLGLDEALIQQESENVDQHLNTAWIMRATRGLLITTVAVISAPYLANFFNEPKAEPIIQTIAAANLLLALKNPAIVYFRKNLNFHKDFLYKITSRLGDTAAAVVFAVYYRSVWALVAGIVASNLIRLTLSYVIFDYRPNVEFNYEYAMEMFGFGKWMLAQSVLLFLLFEADDAFVGWFFATSSLGFYQLAYRYSNAPATEVTQIIGRVAFPAFSKVQNDTKSLRTGFYRVLRLSTIVTFPMATGIAVVTPQFVYGVLGQQWSPMIPVMQILAVWGAMRSLEGSFGPVYVAVGRPDIEVKILSLKIFLVGLLIFPAAQQGGLVGVASILVLQSIVTQPVMIYITLSIVDGSYQDFASIVVYPLFGSLIMAAVVFIVDNYLFQRVGIIQFTILTLLGVAVYCGVMIEIERRTKRRFLAIYKDIQRIV